MTLHELFERTVPMEPGKWNLRATQLLELLPAKITGSSVKLLGHVRMMHSEGNAASFTEPHSRDGDPRFSAMTNGVFPDDVNWAATAIVEYQKEGRPAVTGDKPDGAIYRYWGLTEDKKWITVEALTVFPDPHDESVRRQIPSCLTLHEAASFSEMCMFAGLEPHKVWSRLAAVFGK